MYLNTAHKKNFSLFYLVCFVLTQGWLVYTGQLLHQLRPVFFVNRLDFTLNLLLLTNIQQCIIQHYWLQWLLDILYLVLPVLLCLSVVKNHKTQYSLAFINLLFNIAYLLLLSSFSVLSIEGMVCWMIVPVIFMTISDRSFYYVNNLVRYFFILIFSSAALWKIRAGGIFNIEQLSGILIKQHTAYLTSAPGDWFSRFVNFLILHPVLGYCIYLASTIGELIFIIGFFTKKYDKLLCLVFLLFVLLDLFLMRINYFSWLVFLGSFWYAKYKEPVPTET